jgi:hypothetical protein
VDVFVDTYDYALPPPDHMKACPQGPVLAMGKVPAEHATAVAIPDFSFHDWPEVGTPGWPDIQGIMKAAVRRYPWDKKVCFPPCRSACLSVCPPANMTIRWVCPSCVPPAHQPCCWLCSTSVLPHRQTDRQTAGCAAPRCCRTFEACEGCGAALTRTDRQARPERGTDRQTCSAWPGH